MTRSATVPERPTLDIDLRGLVVGAAREDLPALAGRFAEAQALIVMRLNASVGEASNSAQERLLSMPEAAILLRIPEDRAYDLARQRRFPVVAIGKYRRVRESALRAYIEANEQPEVQSSRRRRA